MMIIDRFEGDYAVVEVRQEHGETVFKNIPLSWLPADICEGDVLTKTAEGYVTDPKETEKRRAEAARKLAEAQDV